MCPEPSRPGTDAPELTARKRITSLILNGFFLFLSRGAQSVFGFLIVFIVSRQLSVPDLAQVLVLLSIALNFGRIGVLGLDVLLVQFLGRAGADKARQGSCILTLFRRFCLIWAGLSALSLGSVGWFWPELDPGVPHWLFILWLFLASLQIFTSSAFLGIGRQFASMIYLGALSNGITFAILMVMAFSNVAVTVPNVAVAYVAGLAVSSVCAAMQLWAIVPPRLRKLGRIEGDIADLSRLGMATLINAVAIVGTQTPIWALGVFGDDLDVVTYGLAFRLILPLTIIILVSRSLSSPLLSRAVHEHSLKAAEPRLREIAGYASLVAIGVALAVLLLGEWVFDVAFQQPQAWNIAVLAFLLFGQLTAVFLGHALLAVRFRDEQRVAFVLTVVPALLSMAGSVLLCQFWGATGASLALAIFAATAAVLPFAHVKRKYGLNTSGRVFRLARN